MTGNNRYCVIHGHFYQPPRENPWLDIVECQPSAAPFHDWNERIYDECYRPNARSRILDSDGRIKSIHNNYSRMSFNIGPTLLRWLEDNHADVAAEIYRADADSVDTFDGHGNAIAQAYNHTILPHASRRDKLTQIRWTKSFFRARFNRDPEGIWLAETAINQETATCLVEEGIRFVVLSPKQAEGFRPMHSDHALTIVDDHGIDIRHPYRLFTSAGFIDVIFFDEPLSRSVSFEGALDNAAMLASKIGGCFSEHPSGDELVTVATDGETFGHHKAFGDMCLAYFFSAEAKNAGITPVNFGWYLAKHPPKFEVTLKNAAGEGTAWSCAHGTGRWIRDCGCQTGGYAHWNQQWRAPFRDALNRLQREIDSVFESMMQSYTPDPWALRDAYMSHLDQPLHSRDIKKFASNYGRFEIASDADAAIVSAQLEAQKFMQYSFTSCAWFFSDIAGIETIQNLMYAGRAIQLAFTKGEQPAVVERFLSVLDNARSNVGGQTGKTIFEKHVLPQMRHLELLAFTAAASKLILGTSSDEFVYFGYRVSLEQTHTHRDGSSGIDSWKAEVSNAQTHEHDSFTVTLTHEKGIRISAQIRRQSKDTSDIVHLKLSDMFTDSKTVFVDHFSEMVAFDALTSYLSWVEEKTDVLNALAEIDGSLPAHLHGPVRFILSGLFNAQADRIAGGVLNDEVFAKMLELQTRSQRFGLDLDYRHAVKILRESLLSELDAWASDMGEKHGDRVRFILNIVDRFGIPLQKNVIEDRFHTILENEIEKFRIDYEENPTPEKKITLLQIIGFARRLNFNTDLLSESL